MEPLLLTDEELEFITEYVNREKQCVELSRLGIPFKPSRSGRPLVTRSAAEKHIGGFSRAGSNYVAPDLEALRTL